MFCRFSYSTLLRLCSEITSMHQGTLKLHLQARFCRSLLVPGTFLLLKSRCAHSTHTHKFDFLIWPAGRQRIHSGSIQRPEDERLDGKAHALRASNNRSRLGHNQKQEYEVVGEPASFVLQRTPNVAWRRTCVFFARKRIFAQGDGCGGGA